jgi:hypothetical protein
MARPIPWPTNCRTTEYPFASACDCTAHPDDAVHFVEQMRRRRDHLRERAELLDELLGDRFGVAARQRAR